MGTSLLQMLFPLGENKTAKVNCVSGNAKHGALQTVVVNLRVGLWVKQKAAYGRTLKTFFFCFSTSENWLSLKMYIALCKLEGLYST